MAPTPARKAAEQTITEKQLQAAVVGLETDLTAGAPARGPAPQELGNPGS